MVSQPIGLHACIHVRTCLLQTYQCSSIAAFSLTPTFSVFKSLWRGSQTLSQLVSAGVLPCTCVSVCAYFLGVFEHKHCDWFAMATYKVRWVWLGIVFCRLLTTTSKLANMSHVGGTEEEREEEREGVFMAKLNTFSGI